MKKMLTLTGIICLFFYSVFPQSITSIVPNTGFSGQVINIVVTGKDASFIQGNTFVEFPGSNIIVKEINVINPDVLTAIIQISNQEPVGLKPVRVMVREKIINSEETFEILEEGENVNVVLSVFPVDILYISDFDPATPANAPFLFSVNLSNDNIVRTLKIVFTLTNSQYGSIASATKNFTEISPLSAHVFNNREFDAYEIQASSDYLNTAFETGILPAGDYNYQVKVLDGNNTELASDNDEITSTNNLVTIDLISPGNPVGDSPEIIATNQPVFQWMSNSLSNAITIYEVQKGQQSIDEINNNIPLHTEEGLVSQTFIYPVYAQALEEGKTYAWQVTTDIMGTRGNLHINSDMYWFTLNTQNITSENIASPNQNSVVRIEMVPKNILLNPNKPMQFHAIGYDEYDNPVPITPEWGIVPSSSGKIDANGLLMLNKIENEYIVNGNIKLLSPLRPVGVIARYNGMMDYAPYNIDPESIPGSSSLGNTTSQIPANGNSGSFFAPSGNQSGINPGNKGGQTGNASGIKQIIVSEQSSVIGDIVDTETKTVTLRKGRKVEPKIKDEPSGYLEYVINPTSISGPNCNSSAYSSVETQTGNVKLAKIPEAGTTVRIVASAYEKGHDIICATGQTNLYPGVQAERTYKLISIKSEVQINNEDLLYTQGNKKFAAPYDEKYFSFKAITYPSDCGEIKWNNNDVGNSTKVKIKEGVNIISAKFEFEGESYTSEVELLGKYPTFIIIPKNPHQFFSFNQTKGKTWNNHVITLKTDLKPPYNDKINWKVIKNGQTQTYKNQNSIEVSIDVPNVDPQNSYIEVFAEIYYTNVNYYRASFKIIVYNSPL